VNSRNCPGEAHLSPASREMQPLVSLAKAIGFLGPEGTFTEECLHAFLGITRQELTGSEGRIKIAPFPSLPDTVEAVTRREVDCALVPIENSTEGSVSATLDILIHGGDGLQIIRETRHSIRQRLITQPGVSVGEVTSLISHPHAAAQCRRWLRENLPDVEVEAANSTASAVKRVAAASEPWAAIGTALAAEMYGCRVAEDSIEDSPDNETRFILLARQEERQDLPEPYKTSVVCGIGKDQPGALLLILQEFAHRYINLTKIESRPSKRGLGDYVFLMDMEGSREEPAVREALRCLSCKLPRLTILGSYPVDK